MTRTRRFVGGLSLGYVYLGLVTVVGLWLTPFLLGRIGTHDYGLWLITTQILGYLMLLDLGVVALVPRETAYATGRAQQGAAPGEVARTLGRFRRLVRWQVGPVAIAAAVGWWLVTARWPELTWPLGIILAAFVVSFPLRLYHAALQGLQDLAFLGTVQLASWAAGTALTVTLAVMGVGLGALAAGWVVTQAVSAAACFARLRGEFGREWGQTRDDVTRTDAIALFSRSVWVSLAQVGQVFLNGSDLLILGAVFGPAATVPYACTGKLVSVLANHPQLLMQTAAPALAEMRTGERRERLVEVALALMRAVLVISGGVACLVLAVNRPFVLWWVGTTQYAGLGLTGLLVVAMLARHLATTFTYTLFALGYERRLSLTALADGLVTVLVTALLAKFTTLGLWSAAVGSLAGVAVVSLPAHVIAMRRELQTGLPVLAASLGPWAVRFAAAAAICLAGDRLLQPTGLTGAAWMGFGAAGVYAALMLPVAMEPPLDTYIRRSLAPLTRWVTRRHTPAPETRS